MIERQLDQQKNIEITDIEGLVPKFHLLRKIERSMDCEQVYQPVEHLYSKDRGRPRVDPVVLIKMVLLQHLYGIRSLRQTGSECQMNIVYRWFLGYGFTSKLPHFSTVSYNFLHSG